MIGNAFRSAYDSDIMKRNTRYDVRENYSDEQGYEEPLKQPEAARTLGGALVKNSILSLAIEQQHLLDELEKCMAALGERLIPISIHPVLQGEDIAKQPKREESEMYSMLSSNNGYIVRLIHRITAIREGVQL